MSAHVHTGDCEFGCDFTDGIAAATAPVIGMGHRVRVADGREGVVVYVANGKAEVRCDDDPVVNLASGATYPAYDLTTLVVLPHLVRPPAFFGRESRRSPYRYIDLTQAERMLLWNSREALDMDAKDRAELQRSIDAYTRSRPV